MQSEKVDKTKICRRSAFGVYKIETVTHQDCRVCEMEKPLEEFYRDSGNRYGRKHICKACEKERYEQGWKLRLKNSSFDFDKRKVKRYQKRYNISYQEAWDMVDKKRTEKFIKCLNRMEEIKRELMASDPEFYTVEYFALSPAERAERLRRRGEELFQEFCG